MTKRFTRNFRTAVVVVGLPLAIASGYWAGIRQAQAIPGTPKTYQLTLVLFHRKLDLNVSLGQLGLMVILALLVLLLVAIFLAVFAQHRRREAEAANRKLKEEISERERA